MVLTMKTNCLRKRPQAQIFDVFLADHVCAGAAVFEPEKGEGQTSLVPEDECEEYDDVPPLVGVTDDVHRSWRHQSLRHLCHVKEHGNSAEKVHDEDPETTFQSFYCFQTILSLKENDFMENCIAAALTLLNSCD